MADLYRDFAYCMVTGFVSAADTVIPVDAVDRLPSNEELAAGDFWMTFESSYALDQFEVVRLVSKDVVTGAGNLTVERAAQGSIAYDRNPGIILKHAVTAEMLRHLVSLVGAGGGYKRYVDLGNFNIAGQAQCFSEPTILRGVAAGQAGGASVVAGLLVDRGILADSDGAALVSADLTNFRPLAGSTSSGSSASSASLGVVSVYEGAAAGAASTAAEMTVTAPEGSAAEVFGTQMFGS